MPRIRVGLGVRGRRRATASRELLLTAIGVLSAAPRAVAQVDVSVEKRDIPAAREACAAASETTRELHHFDFNERALGNLEDTPMFWEAVRSPGFPTFAVGEFDVGVGRSAPPSFRLTSSGRNVAYVYRGPATPVRPRRSYRINGFVRTEGVVHARVVLSAYYVNAEREPLEGTLMQSAWLADDGGKKEWRAVHLLMPTAPTEAHSIELMLALLQEETWDRSPQRQGHVAFKDVSARVWLDDVSIHVLPTVDVIAGNEMNVFEAGDPSGIEFVINTFDEVGADCSLEVFDVDGTVVHSEMAGRGGRAGAKSLRIMPQAFPPGVYRAVLRVSVEGEALSQWERTFVTLARRRQDRPVSTARSFGVALDAGDRAPLRLEADLLIAQGVRSAKLPLWPGPRNAEIQDAIASGSPLGTDPSLLRLVRSGFHLTGVFSGIPGRIAEEAGAYPLSLPELLNVDAAGWRRDLEDVVAPNATVISAWQAGQDGDLDLLLSGELPAGTRRLREEMNRFLSSPILCVPETTSLDRAPTEGDRERTCLTIGREVGGAHISGQVARFEKVFGEGIDVFLAGDGDKAYERLPALARWAQRVLLARHAATGTVYVPQTWGVAPGDGAVVPRETFVLLRTITDVIADAKAGPAVQFGKSAKALVFVEGDRASVALWDEGAGSQGREHVIQVGDPDAVVDLWGRESAPEMTDDGRLKVTLTTMPVLVEGAEAWTFAFADRIRFEPATVPFSIEPQSRTLELGNPTGLAMAGTVEIGAPPEWEARPASFRFNVPPGGSVGYPVELRYPSAASAGVKKLAVKVTVDGPKARVFEMEVPLELGIAGLDIWGTAFRRGNSIIVRHVVRNRTTEQLSFRGFAATAGRPRQYRNILDISPGQTRVEEYAFPAMTRDADRRVRLGLRELNGPRIHNLDVAAP
ncbi:MAG: hypothetical protein BroJett003_12140 [Planctomycetota bacterium]|nr:MAG: hypothetical protein BroJett003_12140 [Planctomycetota bacterium]